MTEKDMNTYKVQAFFGCCEHLLENIDALIFCMDSMLNSENFNPNICRRLVALMRREVDMLKANWDRAKKTAMSIPLEIEQQNQE